MSFNISCFREVVLYCRCIENSWWYYRYSEIFYAVCKMYIVHIDINTKKLLKLLKIRDEYIIIHKKSWCLRQDLKSL